MLVDVDNPLADDRQTTSNRADANRECMKIKTSKSKRGGKAAKPRPDFPLTPHPNGWWCKKVRGKLHYFGKIAEDPEGNAAVDEWLDEKEDLLAGRTPRVVGDGLTVRDLVNRFLTVKHIMGHSGASVAAAYRERIEDDRLAAVAKHVHSWLFPLTAAKDNPKTAKPKSRPERWVLRLVRAGCSSSLALSWRRATSRRAKAPWPRRRGLQCARKRDCPKRRRCSIALGFSDVDAVGGKASALDRPSRLMGAPHVQRSAPLKCPKQSATAMAQCGAGPRRRRARSTSAGS